MELGLKDAPSRGLSRLDVALLKLEEGLDLALLELEEGPLKG